MYSALEFSLARYSDIAVYANNSIIDVNLVGKGFEGFQITDGGALECHTDDTTCCRGIDNPNGPGRGEWYYPDGTVVPPPGDGTGFYRTRDYMVIRLNRGSVLFPVGVYRCEIPGTGGVNITRHITLSSAGKTTCLLHFLTLMLNVLQSKPQTDVMIFLIPPPTLHLVMCHPLYPLVSDTQEP